jgi:hypothetical protein
MVLNPEGRVRFQQHLQNVMRMPCSVCGTSNWQGEDAIFELREFAGGGLTNEGSVKPVLAMTCNGCGQVIFMSPLKTGIIALAQQAQPQEAAAEAVEVTDDEVL